MLPETTDVLIVGAGPTGLVTAISLAQRGVRFTIVDRLAEQQNTSRAAVIHVRPLDMLKEIGVAERLIAQGLRMPRFRIRDRSRLLMEANFDRLKTATPFALMIPQDESESILIARLAELGHQVHRGVNVTAVDIAPAGAQIAYDGPARSGRITARFVVGADGERSLVRQQAGIGYPGETYGSFLLADVRMRWPLAREEVTLFFSREGTLVVAPMSRERFRVVAQLPNAPSVPTIADVQSLIDTRGPHEETRVTELLWGSRFQVHHRLADTFVKPPVVLAGDAAHVHSPAGGQGMNLGIRDGLALADALATTLAQGGTDALQRYAEAQRAQAQRVLAMTDRLTALATMANPLMRGLRNGVIATAGRFAFVRDRLARTLAGYR